MIQKLGRKSWNLYIFAPVRVLGVNNHCGVWIGGLTNSHRPLNVNTSPSQIQSAVTTISNPIGLNGQTRTELNKLFLCQQTDQGRLHLHTAKAFCVVSPQTTPRFKCEFYLNFLYKIFDLFLSQGVEMYIFSSLFPKLKKFAQPRQGHLN